MSTAPALRELIRDVVRSTRGARPRAPHHGRHVLRDHRFGAAVARRVVAGRSAGRHVARRGAGPRVTPAVGARGPGSAPAASAARFAGPARSQPLLLLLLAGLPPATVSRRTSDPASGRSCSASTWHFSNGWAISTLRLDARSATQSRSRSSRTPSEPPAPRAASPGRAARRARAAELRDRGGVRRRGRPRRPVGPGSRRGGR